MIVMISFGSRREERREGARGSEKVVRSLDSRLVGLNGVMGSLELGYPGSSLDR